MSTSRHHPLNATIRLLILAMLVVPLTIGTTMPARAFDSPASVDLGAAGDFAILTKAGITNVTPSAITGNLGTSPITDTAITGFALVLDSTGTFSTSTQVTGRVYAAEYTEPTTTNLTTAVSNMEAAYTDAATRVDPNETDLMSGDLDGQTLAPGLYKWTSDVHLGQDGPETLTLSGPADAVWIFQIDGNLTLGSDNAKVELAGGALPENIFWQVAGGVGVELGTGSHMEGNILAYAAINLRTGATLNGRALAQTEVTLQMNTVVAPTGTPLQFFCDDKTDPTKFYSSTGSVWWLDSVTDQWISAFIGTDATEYIRRSNFDGDCSIDPAKFVAGPDALWYLESSTGEMVGVYMGAETYSLIHGTDYDGDGKTDPAKYVPADGAVWYLSSITDAWEGMFVGTDADPVLPGSDFDGDLKDDFAKYVPAAGAIWYFESGTSTWQSVYIGSDGEPVAGSDFDADGMTDPAKFVSGSNALWYLESSTSTWQSVYMGPGTYEIVIASDFDGDGNTDPAKFVNDAGSLWYKASLTGEWVGVYMGDDAYEEVN